MNNLSNLISSRSKQVSPVLSRAGSEKGSPGHKPKDVGDAEFNDKQKKIQNEMKVFLFVKTVWSQYDRGSKQYLSRDEVNKFTNKVLGPMLGRSFVPVPIAKQIDSRVKNPKAPKSQNYFFNHEYDTIFKQMNLRGNGYVQKTELAQYMCYVNDHLDVLREKS